MSIYGSLSSIKAPLESFMHHAYAMSYKILVKFLVIATYNTSGDKVTLKALETRGNSLSTWQ